jgi:tetratricopeptide (TPR) repeat protein
MISFLRFTDWDADLFNTFSIPIVDKLKEINAFSREALKEGLIKLWQGYFYTETNTDIIAEIGRVLISINEYEMAREKYELFNKVRKDNAVGLNNLGVCLVNLGRGEEAKALFERALEIEPDFSDPSFWLGEIKSRQVASTPDSKEEEKEECNA